MLKKKLLISSCFLGDRVKYNGSHNKLDDEILKKLKERYELYPICPEVEGGLETPRTPCEIVSNDPMKVLNKEGVDKTKEFLKGANIAYEFCKKEEIKLALMKANSPSCSNDLSNDGTFTKTRIKQDGVSVRSLRLLDINIFNESEVEQLF